MGQTGCANRELKNLIYAFVPTLRACPSTGNGVHPWLFKTATLLHKFGCKPDQIFSLLKEHSSDCGREVPDSEIEDAVRNSSPNNAGAWGVPSSQGKMASRAKSPAAATPDYQRIGHIGMNGLRVAQLKAASPFKCCHGVPGTEAVIDKLFLGNPLLCCGSTKQFYTRSREGWRGSLSGLPLIVPSPMSAPYGRTKGGKGSARCLDNTGPRRYLVVEFDFKVDENNPAASEQNNMLATLLESGRTIKDLCASLIAEIAKHHPLALVVDSGGKSLHAWLPTRGLDENYWRHQMDNFLVLGADPATFTRCQMVRMPGGTRENGNHQEIIYFNPEVLPCHE